MVNRSKKSLQDYNRVGESKSSVVMSLSLSMSSSFDASTDIDEGNFKGSFDGSGSYSGKIVTNNSRRRGDNSSGDEYDTVTTMTNNGLYVETLSAFEEMIQNMLACNGGNHPSNEETISYYDNDDETIFTTSSCTTDGRNIKGKSNRHHIFDEKNDLRRDTGTEDDTDDFSSEDGRKKHILSSWTSSHSSNDNEGSQSGDSVSLPLSVEWNSYEKEGLKNSSLLLKNDNVEQNDDITEKSEMSKKKLNREKKRIGGALDGENKSIGETLDGENKSIGETLDSENKSIGETLELEHELSRGTLDGENKSIGEIFDGEGKAFGGVLDNENDSIAAMILSLEKENKTDGEHEIPAAPNQKYDFDVDPATLYRAIDTKSWKEAHKVLQNSPEEASAWVYRCEDESDKMRWMFLPLHVACFSGAPLNLMKKLVAKYPKAVRIAPENDGKLPFHIACETYAPSAVIEFLHDSYPEAMYRTDYSGNTPLQEVMFSDNSAGRARVMKLLISFSTKDNLSLHSSNDSNCNGTESSKSLSKFSLKKLRKSASSRRRSQKPLKLTQS